MNITTREMCISNPTMDLRNSIRKVLGQATRLALERDWALGPLPPGIAKNHIKQHNHLQYNQKQHKTTQNNIGFNILSKKRRIKYVTSFYI